jgi:C1A family cysteine protease
MKLLAVTLAALALPARIAAVDARQLAAIDAQATSSLEGYFSTCPGAGDAIPCLSGQVALELQLTVAIDSQAYVDAAAKFVAAALEFGINTADYAVQYVLYRKTAYVINVVSSTTVLAELSAEAKGDLVLGTSWLTFLTATELAAINGYLEDTVNPWFEGERLPPANSTNNPTDSPVVSPTTQPTKSPENSPTTLPTESPVQNPTKAPTTSSPTKAPVLATEINWAIEGVVGPVLNQGSCVSCWAFAAVSASQGLSAIETGYLNLLSPQQLVDCAPEDNVCYGCDGGNYVTLWRNGKGYATKNYIATAASYEYTAKTETCVTTGTTAVFKADGVIQLSRNNAATDEEIKALVRKQPVSVSISAGCRAFSSYKSGILTASACVSGCDSPRIDHAVLIVGFGVDASTQQEFWIVQNSWGTSWGEEGFVRLAMSGDIYNEDLKAYGTCGINANPAAPESAETKEGCEQDKCGGEFVGTTPAPNASGTTPSPNSSGNTPTPSVGSAGSSTLGGVICLAAAFLATQNL